MLSSTTIEPSTSMPTPSAMPAREITFSVKPLKYIRAIVASTEIGIAAPTISVARMSRRKNISTSTASAAPNRAPNWTLFTAWRMNSAPSMRIVISARPV